MGCFNFKGLFSFGKRKTRNPGAFRVIYHNLAAIPSEAACLTPHYAETIEERTTHVVATVADAAAVRIQAAFRCFRARKALRALRSLVKLQAVVRGFLVRKQVSETRSVQSRILSAARAERGAPSYMATTQSFRAKMRSKFAPKERLECGGKMQPPCLNADIYKNAVEMAASVDRGSDQLIGHIISTTIGGKNDEPKRTISYMAERVAGIGSFGIVFQAKCLETGETVAIKKVLQDRRYENRELQLMRLMDHPNVVSLKHCFFSTTSKDEVFLNLVMEYVPETMYRVLEHYNNANQRMPLIYVKLYCYQIFRGLAYLHAVPGVCHRDVKPQNLLVDPLTHQVKLCDFGCAKVLMKGEANISYICTRYYRAPELIFGATEYTTSIDIWSAGCVLAELLLGQPLFPGENSVDQLAEIIKVLGTPTREEIRCMNPSYTDFRFPQVKAHPLHKIFYQRMPPDAIDLASCLLQYSPSLRCTALEACAHSFFDELRDPNTRLPNGRTLPPLFNFKQENKYKRGISGWNFNIEDVKAQASLIQDIDDCVADDITLDANEKQFEFQSLPQGHLPQVDEVDDYDLTRDLSSPLPPCGPALNGLKARNDKSDDEPSVSSSIGEVQPESNGVNLKSKRDVDKANVYARGGGSTESNALSDIIIPPSPAESGRLAQIMVDNFPNSNGGTTPQPGNGSVKEAISRQPNSGNDDLDEKARGPVVQQKGRFKVTSENLDMKKAASSPMLQKSLSMQVISQHQGVPLAPPSIDAALPTTQHGTSIFPMLLSILHANVIQRDAILNLMKQISGGEATDTGNHDSGNIPLPAKVTEKSMLEAAHDREKELLLEVTDLQWRLFCVQEELYKYKTEHAQGALKDKMHQTKHEANDLKETAKGKAHEMKEKSKEAAGDMSEKTKEASRRAAEKAEDMKGRAKDKAYEMKETTKDMADKAKEGGNKTAEAVQNMGEKAKQTVQGAWEAAKDNTTQKVKETLVGKDDESGKTMEERVDESIEELRRQTDPDEFKKQHV